MRACVIGAGVVGCAVGRELRRSGYDVTVIDKNGDVGHGSTSASCGIVRRFYSQPGMIAMAHEAHHIWAGWDEFIGPIGDDTIDFPRPGMLFIPPRIDDSVRATLSEMTRIGIRAALLSADEVAERFPFLDVAAQFPPRPADDPDFFTASGRRIEGAVFEEDAGYVVFPSLAAQNLRRAGEREGVRFLMHQQISRISKIDPRRFLLQTTGGMNLEAEVVVNVAGPHSSVINRIAGVKLQLETRPLRREVHALDNPLSRDSPTRSDDPPHRGNPLRGSAGTAGESGGRGEGDEVVLPIVGDLDGGIYFRPESGGRKVIVGSTDPKCDKLEFVDDPDDFNRSISPVYRERQCLRLMKRFPSVHLGPERGVADLYDVTVRDWYPIVDRTDLPGYYVCIGTSGSSFKTAPVLGMLTARIVEACEGGADVDRTPLQFELPRIGRTIDTRFLSRLRGEIATSGTVIG